MQAFHIFSLNEDYLLGAVSFGAVSVVFLLQQDDFPFEQCPLDAEAASLFEEQQLFLDFLFFLVSFLGSSCFTIDVPETEY